MKLAKMRELLLCKAVPPQWRAAYAALLADTGLRDEGHTDLTALLTEDGVLLGCGSLGGKVIRQVAVSPAAEGQDACARIVSALVQEAVNRGVPYPFLFTKPQNARLFRSLGFYPVVKTADMVMLCRQRDALRRFLEPLPRWQEGVTGCVVCHANPFTKGHLHLITTAAAQCDHVLVFVVAEEGGPFPAADRLMLVREGTAHLSNVSVCSGSDFLVSRTTFPAYFLRDEQAEDARCDLDLTLFAQHIAPALHITRRFVGEEPFSPTTAAYNRRMTEMLPSYGISVTEIPRLENISATAVRQLLAEGRLSDIHPLVPETTYAYCQRHFGGHPPRP